MSDVSPYDDLIMDHIRNARNFRVPEVVGRTAEGSNPLCGDEMVVYVRIEAARIEDVAFQCSCCGISMASASIMTQIVKGSRADEARRMIADVVAMLETRCESAAQPMTPERRALLETVRKYPARSGCAALAWTTLRSALAPA